MKLARDSAVEASAGTPAEVESAVEASAAVPTAPATETSASTSSPGGASAAVPTSTDMPTAATAETSASTSSPKEEGGSFDACSFPTRVSEVKMFSPPRQRQRWGDKQVLSPVNWGDIFFDFFYMAAAYNLSDIIIESPSLKGLLYFIGLLGPVMTLWFTRVTFDSRYALHDDPFHRAFEVLQLCFLATAVVHISEDVMSDPAESPDMFAYSMGMSLLGACNVFRSLEIVFFVVGEEAAKVSARKDLWRDVCQSAFYLAAAVISGIQFYSNLRERHSDVPIWLCMAGWLFSVFYNIAMVLWFPGGEEHKKTMNIDVAIHRYGEGVMLLLGESVVSVLIAETSDSSRYYITFYCALISIVLIQYLHYRSQPHRADEHALRKSTSGMFFVTILQIYSIALVAISVSYSMILYDVTYEHLTGSHRRLRWIKSAVSRFLAGGGPTEYSQEERRQRVADFFCGSLALAWICCEMMLISHNSVRRSIERCECKTTNKFSKTKVLFCVFRAGMIVFIATLSQYVTDPLLITVIGLAAIITELFSRVLGDLIFPEAEVCEDGDDDGGSEHERWPNVTEPLSEPLAGPADKATVEEDV